MPTTRRGVDIAYRVRIDYREPTYEARVGAKSDPYSWTYEILATTPQEAAEDALRQFREITRVSNVGWLRQVVSVRVLRPVA